MSSNWLDSNVIVAYRTNVGREVTNLTREPIRFDRTIMVDTNYLTLINNKDLASMLLDPNYEMSISSPQKKQMARMFRDFLNRKIDLCFSDMIMREFIGRAPKRKDLLEVYKKYIIVVSPRNSFGPYFFDLAAAINSCIIETGEESDVKDTYSYILAALSNVRYFVTEDPDVERVYRYLSGIREKDYDDRKREIRKIKGVYKLLCSTPNTEFPIDEVLGFLLFDESEPLPIPISIARLEDRLPEVLDRSEVILWMLRSLREINELRELISETPPEWDEEMIRKARERIVDISESIGVQRTGVNDECSFYVKLVEEGTNWTEQDSDREMASNLSSQLDLLRGIVYSEETEDEYIDWEERFYSEESTKEFKVVCKECGTRFEIEADYNGVTNVEPREMGSELCHEWLGESSCPSCKNKVSVVHELWEYPQFFYNYDDTECSGCELLREETTRLPTTTLSDYFDSQTKNS